MEKEKPRVRKICATVPLWQWEALKHRVIDLRTNIADWIRQKVREEVGESPENG